eukprot:11157400-Lingulodinium_polyedra.AAC.1
MGGYHTLDHGWGEHCEGRSPPNAGPGSVAFGTQDSELAPAPASMPSPLLDRPRRLRWCAADA